MERSPGRGQTGKKRSSRCEPPPGGSSSHIFLGADGPGALLATRTDPTISDHLGSPIPSRSASFWSSLRDVSSSQGVVSSALGPVSSGRVCNDSVGTDEPRQVAQGLIRCALPARSWGRLQMHVSSRLGCRSLTAGSLYATRVTCWSREN